MSVRTIVKSIQDIMRQDTGVDGDAQRISQLCWMFFLKIIDDQDQELEMLASGYRSPIPENLKWRTWAANPEGITGEELLTFINGELFPALKRLTPTGQKGDRRRVVRDVFEDAYNYMKSGQLMRQVINKITQVDFNNLAERQHFGDIYEQILNDLQSAGNAGEYYIPKMTGTAGQKRVPTQYFAHSPFPLPPLAEQHRIVAKVDELMALCDRLEGVRADRETTRDRLSAASLGHLNAPSPDPAAFRNHAYFALDNLAALTTRPEQVKHLRQTILNLAVRGRLVPQDSSDEPATEVLNRIAAERNELIKKRIIRAQEPVAPIDPTEHPFAVRSNWVWSRIGAVALFTQYGTSQRADATENGVPVLTMGNIQGGLVARGNEKTIPEDTDELPSLYLRKFDILYNRTNSAELVGKTGIYLGEDDTVTFASYLIRIRSSLSSCPRYLNLAMNAPDFRKTQIIPLIKKQTGQANVNGTALKNMLVPLPPLAEQHRIAAKVDELIELCDRLETILTTGDATRYLLLNALLAEALAPKGAVAPAEGARVVAHG
jgi:restriction endonuclease S subunit